MMIVRYSYFALLLKTFISCFTDVDIGFVQSVYRASEHSMSVMICVDVVQGILGIPVNLSISTHSITADGMYIHVT